MRRTRLRHRSKRMEAKYRERRKVVRAIFEEHPVCPRCMRRPAVDPHEPLSRARGGSITDPDNIVPLCRECHDEITQNPEMGEAEGWLLPSRLPEREWERSYE